MSRIVARWIAAAVLLAFAPFSAQTQSTSGPLAPKPDVEVQQDPAKAKSTVRVQVALVNMPVTVRDSHGEMVHNLEAANFKVTDNDVTQQISHFDLGGDPISMVILVETSSRIEPILPQIRKTGILLTQTVMGPSDEAAVVSFNDSIDKLQDFTTNGDLIENTISHLAAGTSGSKLYDAMAVGVEMLSGRLQGTAERPGRRRVLLILSEATDGEHRGSQAKLGEVLRQAQLANVTIYSVGLSTTRAELQSKPKALAPRTFPVGSVPPAPGVPATPTYEDSYHPGGGDLMALATLVVRHIHDQVKGNPLEIAAASTGGQEFSTFKDRSIEKAIDEIGGELHSQYTISYTPTGSDAAGYHEIKVSILRDDAKKLKVRSRLGYYLGEPES
jgi:VWFA-related protein